MLLTNYSFSSSEWLCVPDIERDRYNGVENNGVWQEHEHCSHCTAYGHTLRLSAATNDASWNEIFPRQIQLEPMTDERLPEATEDSARQAGTQQKDEDLQRINYHKLYNTT